MVDRCYALIGVLGSERVCCVLKGWLGIDRFVVC